MSSAERGIRGALRTERSRLCDFLDRLETADWSTQSLCDAWNVREVVAHLTSSTRTSVFDVARGMARHLGNFDRMEAERARRRARDLTPNELIEQLRADVDSTATSPGSSPIDALVDVVVHSQDIAIPLGKRHPISPEHAVMALQQVRSSRWYGAEKRIGDATLRATDIDWTSGTGTATITGTAVDLLLATSGRSAGLKGLSGSGVATLHAALRP